MELGDSKKKGIVESDMKLFSFMLESSSDDDRDELTVPKDKDSEIICFCKVSLRGYEAAIVLEDLGYTNVKVMEGGIMAWPYQREK